MSLHEMALSITNNERGLQSLQPSDLSALVEAMPEDARARFWFSRSHNLNMANALWNRVNGDAQVAEAPTVDQLWTSIKRIAPAIQDALTRPLDRSKYVERDLGTTPRRRIS